jgi:hypothetical protein
LDLGFTAWGDHSRTIVTSLKVKYLLYANQLNAITM